MGRDNFAEQLEVMEISAKSHDWIFQDAIYDTIFSGISKVSEGLEQKILNIDRLVEVVDDHTTPANPRSKQKNVQPQRG